MIRYIKAFAHKILDIISYAIFHFQFYGKREKLVREICLRQKVRIAFVVGNLPMWKCQDIVDRFKQSEKVDVKIVLSPNTTFPIEQQRSDIDALKSYFDSIMQDYEDYPFDGVPYDLKESFNPDIVFFQQSYENITHKSHDYNSYKDKLISYIPYSFWPGAEPYGFDLPFHRYAWRIYYANDLILRYAKSVSLIGARNSVVVGYPSTDLFLKGKYRDVWHIKDRSIKRIIWAPHFTIQSRAWNTHSSFLEIAYGMIDFAQRNKGKLQIAFKPHPKLKSELYLVWGKDKTEKYYSEWNNMENTQLETGSYIDLFMTSDCLIHDCGSFLVEYQYSQKPSLYILKDNQRIRPTLNDLGKSAFDIHYKGETIKDIEDFVQKVVIDGVDTKSKMRKEFYREQLLPPGNCSVAENIFNNICKSVGI